MKVWIITKEKILCVLRLSNINDSSSGFSDTSLPSQVPVDIFKEGDSWACQSRPGAELIVYNAPANRSTCTKVQLKDRISIKISDNRDTYLLYAEDRRDNEESYSIYDIEHTGLYLIGSDKRCQFYYQHPCVSGEHAQLQWISGKWYVKNCANSFGTYVNGLRIEYSELNPGDSVFIMGLCIIIGIGFVLINSDSCHVVLRSANIRQINDIPGAYFSDCIVDYKPRDFFERQPRKRMRIHNEKISIESPPMPLSGDKIPLLLRLGSPMLMGGRALATGNIFMAMTSMVMPAMTQGMTEKDRKEYETRRLSGYRKYLKSVEEEIRQEALQEQNRLNAAYPYLTEVMRFAISKSRLWERRKTDDDFLQIRIGSGQIPLLAQREYQERHFELEPDILTEEMYKIAEAPVPLKNVPVMLDLRQDYIVGIPGPAKGLQPLVRNLLLLLALTHSYDEVKIVLLVDENNEYFTFTRYLPHLWNNDRTIRFYVSNASDALRVGEYLGREMETVLGGAGKEEELRRKPSYVVFALNKQLFDRIELFKEIMFQQQYCGISIIAAFEGVPKDCKQLIELRSDFRLIDLTKLDAEDIRFTPDAFDDVTAQDSIRELTRTKLLVGSAAFALPDLVTFLQMFHVGVLDDLNILDNWDWKKDNLHYNPFKSLAAPIGIGTDGELFFLDLHEKAHGPHGLVAGTTGSGKSEFLITYILSMAVLYSPELVSFALIDYKGGGLTTAFEFSEELEIEKDGVIEKQKRSYRLPHLAGTITNLDGAAIQRSIMSIESEIKRREALFQEANDLSNEGKIEIYEYQKLYKEGKVRIPLPHLFIIADEFAELRSKEPAFMDTLISITRVGRSLGMHLILATQKPGGIVSPEMWSNMKTHVCLRVQERTDSMDMLRRSEAVELRQSGRFYLQVGNNEYFALGQSAWCGADYIPQAETMTSQDEAIQFLDNVGQVIVSKKQSRVPANTKEKPQKQLVSLVKLLSNIGKEYRISSPRLWADPLPNTIEFTNLWEIVLREHEYVQKLQDAKAREMSATSENRSMEHEALKIAEREYETDREHWQIIWSSISTLQPSEEQRMPVLLGILDDPEHQCQLPYYLDMLSFNNLLLVGNAGSGKSTFLRTMLYALFCAYTPQDISYYILDLSNGALADYRNTPYCGAYLTEKNETDLNRFFTFIREIIEERKQLFSEAGVTDFLSYRSMHMIPLVLVILDGYMNLAMLQNGAAYQSSIQEYLREGVNFGVRYILTCNHVNEVSIRGKQELDLKVAIQLKDRYEYAELLNTRCTYEPASLPGRGMLIQDGRVLTYHVCQVDCDLKGQAQSESLQKRLAGLVQKLEVSKRARQLPMPDMDQTYEEFCDEFKTKERFPLGYAKRTMKPVAVPFQQLHSVSLYFGNPAGVIPVIQNFISAAQWNDMEIHIVKRKRRSAFESWPKDALELPNNAIYYQSTQEGTIQLHERLIQAMRERNTYSREYCKGLGLPDDYPGKAMRASKYIRSKTKAIFVLFERFEDFCRAQESIPVEDGKLDMGKEFGVFFSQMRGYNIYFVACFYPDDSSDANSSHPLWSVYHQDKLEMGKIDLLFGGRYNKAVFPNLTYDEQKIEKPLPKYNRCVLKYREESYPVIMPCGNLEKADVDPDELPIISDGG